MERLDRDSASFPYLFIYLVVYLSVYVFIYNWTDKSTVDLTWHFITI